MADVLAPGEVEQLLAQVGEPGATTVVHRGDGRQSRKGPEAIQAYDFRSPVFLAGGELRKLRQRHEEFVRALAARLSIYLRLEFGLQMAKLHTLTYQKFTDGLANPTHLTLFKVEPLRGICLLDIHPRLGLTIVDRLMGGAASAVTASRDLTEIEVALLDQAVHLILNEWCNHWASLQQLHLVLLGHETNGRFLQTAPHDTALLVLTMEARLGDCMEQMQIAFPCYSLEPLVRLLGEELGAEAHPAPKAAAAKPQWNHEFAEVGVPVTAEWEGLELTARELAALKLGDVLQLPAEGLNRVQLRLAGTPKFTATLGTRGKWLAVSVNQILKK